MSGVRGVRPRRRADAQRSITAIRAAAIDLLGRRPEASMEEIAAHAGVARQTVYAHFFSRDALLAAVVEQLTGEVVAALDAAELDADPPTDALLRWVDVSWSLMTRYPILLTPALAADSPAAEHARHLPITDRLDRLVRRGQETGALDRDAPPDWLVAAVVALGHAAAQEARAGRMSMRDAGTAYRESVRRICVPGAS